MLLCPALLLAAPVIHLPEKVSQGRAFMVEVEDSADFSGATLQWGEKSIILQASPQGESDVWKTQTLFGVDMSAKGSQNVVLTLPDKSRHSKKVSFAKVPWIEQRLTVEPKYVSPPKDVLDRIEKESAHNRALLQTVSLEQWWETPFVRPVKGTVSSSFGGRRVFNGEARSPHRGTDLRGPTGTAILSMAAGRVILSADQYYSGNVVYVDHGQGLVSMYAHMSERLVEAGDMVEKGHLLGKIGATGRVTGPHLHLGVQVLGTAVDAMPFFEKNWQPVGGPTLEVKNQSAPAQQEKKKK